MSTFRIVAKLATRVAVSSRAGQPARAAMVLFAVALFTSAVWLTAGFWSASQRNETRDRERSPVVVFDGEEGVPIVGDSLPMLDGRQFQIMWLSESHEEVPREFGDAVPQPGHAFVSPALLEDAGGAPGVRERFGIIVDRRNADVNWDALTAFAGEYLAFAVLPEGREMPPRSMLLGFDADDLDAPIATAPVSVAEYVTPVGPVAVASWIDERVPSPTQAFFGGLFLLVIPSVFVLLIGLSAHSQLRSQRWAALSYLGAGRPALSGLDGVETAVLSLPTALIVSAAMWMLLGRITSLPGGAIEYFQGDLRPLPSTWALAVASVVVAPVAAGMLTPRVAMWQTQRQRRTARRTGTFLLFVPVVASLAVPAIPSELRAAPFLVVLVSVIAVVPMVAAGLLPYLGVLLAGATSPAKFVAGRRLQWGDHRAVNLLRITTLAVVAVVVASSMSLAGALPSKGSGLPRGIVSISVTGGMTGAQVRDLQSRLADVRLVAVGDGRVFSGGCEPLADLINVEPDTCATNPAHVNAVGASSPLGRFGRISDDSPADSIAITQIVARVDSDAENLRVQSTVNAMFGPSQVLGWDRLGPNPIIGWVSALTNLGAVLLGAALALLLVDTVRFPSASDEALRLLTAPFKLQRSTLRWTLHSVVWLGALLGAGYGLLVNSAGQPAQITRVENWPLVTAAILTGAAISFVVEMGAVAAMSLSGGRSPRGGRDAVSPEAKQEVVV